MTMSGGVNFFHARIALEALWIFFNAHEETELQARKLQTRPNKKVGSAEVQDQQGEGLLCPAEQEHSRYETDFKKASDLITRLVELLSFLMGDAQALFSRGDK